MQYDRDKALPFVLPGQRVLTAAGVPAVVAYVERGVVHAWVGRSPVPRSCIVVTDAWGGEADMAMRNAA